jgi:hypothetical protein
MRDRDRQHLTNLKQHEHVRTTPTNSPLLHGQVHHDRNKIPKFTQPLSSRTPSAYRVVASVRPSFPPCRVVQICSSTRCRSSNPPRSRKQFLEHLAERSSKRLLLHKDHGCLFCGQMLRRERCTRCLHTMFSVSSEHWRRSGWLEAQKVCRSKSCYLPTTSV